MRRLLILFVLLLSSSPALAGEKPIATIDSGGHQAIIAVDCSACNSPYLINLADTYSRLKMYEKVLAMYEKVLRLDAEYLATYAEMARLALLMGRKKEAYY